MEGTLACPNAVVNTKAVVGCGVFVSAAAVIDHDSMIEDFCHINMNATVMAEAEVKPGTKVNAGEVRKNCSK